MFSDGLFKWWEMVCEAYEANQPLSEEEKQQALKVHLDILDELIKAKANLHLWDSEELYTTLGCRKLCLRACGAALTRCES